MRLQRHLRAAVDATRLPRASAEGGVRSDPSDVLTPARKRVRKGLPQKGLSNVRYLLEVAN